MAPESLLDAAAGRSTSGADAGTGPPPIGPSRIPPADDVARSAAASPAVVVMTTFAAYRTGSGRELTAKGNLRLADARHLVDALHTGDDLTVGGHRALQSADQLPELSRILDLALEAGVLQEHGRRLRPNGAADGVDPVELQRRLAMTALDLGLLESSSRLLDSFGGTDAVEHCGLLLLTALPVRPGLVEELFGLVRITSGR